MKSKVESQTAKVGRWSMVGILSGVLFCLLTVHCSLLTASAQTSSFTYQGKLADSGVAANGTYDITFKLFDMLANGTQVGTDIVRDDVVVSDGGFTVDLDFGAAAFANGGSRFLQLEVRPGASTGAFTPLVPRQPLTSSPYAVKAASATSSDSLTAACALCVTDGHIFSISGGKISANSITADKFAEAAVTQNAIRDGNVTTDKIADGAVTNGKLAPGSVDATQLSDNSVTAAKIAAGAVKTEDLDDGSVTTPKIANGSVAGSKIANGAVTTTKLADASVTRAKLAVDFRNGFDPQQVALQRWDQIPVVPRFWEVWRTPSALAFDGTFVYVASKLDNNVQRIRTSTGVIEGAPITTSISAPTALVYDGTFVHVANSGGNSVSRIRASTGVPEAEFSLGCSPIAMTYDGTYLYVACAASNFLRKLVAATYASSGTIDMTLNPAAMVYDGSSVYVTTINANLGMGGDIKRINSDGSVDSVTPTPAIGAPSRAMAFDGTFIYSSFGSSVFRIRKSTGLHEAFDITFPTTTGTVLLNNNSLIFDGTYLFGSANGQTLRLSPTGLAPDGQPIPIHGRVTALIFDGTYTYAAADRTMSLPSGTTVILNGGVTRISGSF